MEPFIIIFVKLPLYFKKATCKIFSSNPENFLNIVLFQSSQHGYCQTANNHYGLKIIPKDIALINRNNNYVYWKEEIE